MKIQVSGNPIEQALQDAVTPPPAPIETLDTGEPATLQDGLPLPDTSDAVQVAGPISAIKGVVGKVLKGSAKEEKAAQEAVNAAAPAPSAPPPTPEPTAPKPPKKTTQQIKQGVMERAVPNVDERTARATADRIMNKPTEPIEPGRTEWRNFRSDKLATPEGVVSLIDQVAKDAGGFQDARRGTRSWAETNEAAKQYGIDELIGSKPGTAWNAEQLSAGREILLELGGRIERAAPFITSGRASAEDMLQFRQMLAQHAGVQQVLQGAVSEAGRALNIMRSVSAAGGRIRSQQVLEALDSMGGDAATRKLAEMVLDSGGDLAKVGQVARKGWGAKSADIVAEVYINGLLSGPTTHVVNTASNSLTALMQMPERAVAGALGKVLPGQEHVDIGEAGAQLYGLLSGWRDALSAAGKTARTGEPSDAIAKLENQNRKAFTSQNLGLSPESNVGKAVDLFGEYYVRLPGRALMAEDEFFKAIGYRMELQAQAYRTAKAEGLSGQELNARIAELVNNPTEDIHMAAEKAARYLTFQDTLAGDNWVQAIGQAGMAATSKIPLLKLVVPFIRTPTNIAQYTLERTPLAPTLKTWRDDVAAGGARRDLALARYTLGSSIAAVVATYAASGRITGNGPSDPKLRNEMLAAGWQPYSVLIGDKYYSYNRLDPVGAMIGAAADGMEVIRYADDEETTAGVAAAVSLGFANAMVNKTYLTGIGGVIDGIRQADEGKLSAIKNVAAKQGAAFVPAWANFIRQNVDDTVREPSKQDILTQTIDMMKNRTPGLSSDLPPKLDVWGEPIRPESAPLSPVRTSTGKQDRVLEELLANRIPITKPAASVSVPLGPGASAAVDLTAIDGTGWLLHNYRQAVGRIAKREMETLVGSKDWPNLTGGPDGEKAEATQRVFMDARKMALDEIMQSHPEIEAAAMAELEAGGTENRMPVPAHMGQ